MFRQRAMLGLGAIMGDDQTWQEEIQPPVSFRAEQDCTH